MFLLHSNLSRKLIRSQVVQQQIGEFRGSLPSKHFHLGTNQILFGCPALFQVAQVSPNRKPTLFKWVLLVSLYYQF
jgi:hypothetical protein